MNVTEAIADVRNEYGDVASAQISDTVLSTWINEAILDIVKRTDCVVSVSSNANLVAGTKEYSSSAHLKVKQVTITVDGQVINLKRIRRSQLEQHQEINSPSRGVPRYFYKEWDTLGFHPTPDAAYLYLVTYVPYPSTVSGSTELPLPKIFHRDVVTWVLERCCRMDEDLARAQQYSQEYEYRIANSLHEHHNQDTESYMVVREVDDDIWFGAHGFD